MKKFDYKFDTGIFNGDVNEVVIFDLLNYQRAAMRLGTVLCRNRKLVSGTTAKMYKQKGTGRARHGDMRANIFVGGGKAFGPKPRSYRQKLNKQTRLVGLLSLLNLKKNENKIDVVDVFDLSELKTKVAKKNLDAIDFKNGVIVVEKDNFDKVNLSVRNLPHLKVLRTDELNPCDLLKYERLLFTKKSISELEEGIKS